MHTTAKNRSGLYAHAQIITQSVGLKLGRTEAPGLKSRIMEGWKSIDGSIEGWKLVDGSMEVRP